MLDDSAQEEKEEELCSKLQLFSTSPGSRSPGVCWESFQATGVGVLQHHRRFFIFCTIFSTIHVLLSFVFQSCHFCSLFFALITFFFISGGVWGWRRLFVGFSYSSYSFVQYRFYYHVFFKVVIFVFFFLALVTIWFISGRGVRTKKIVRVDEVMRRSFNCSHSSSTRLRTALDESQDSTQGCKGWPLKGTFMLPL